MLKLGCPWGDSTNVPEPFTLRCENRSWKYTYYLESILMVPETVGAVMLMGEEEQGSGRMSWGPLRVTPLPLVEKTGVTWQ